MPTNITISAVVLLTIILVARYARGFLANNSVLRMFLALGEMCQKRIERPSLSAGLRTDGLGTLIGGIFNTFPAPRSTRTWASPRSQASARATSAWRAARS